MSADGGEARDDAADAPAIAAEGLRKRYVDGSRRIDAVADVTLTVPRGQLWVLRGPSGSGKTTLLGMLGGMLVPSRGSVALMGDDVTHLRDHHRTEVRRHRVGFVFQELSLVSRMSVRENVLLPLVPLGGATKAHERRAEALLERFGIGDRADSPVESLSGGQRQRAALARGLVLDPPLVLLDEPTAHLDTDNALEVVALLAELRDDGRTVIAATHDPRLADDARVDRVIRMRDGRVEEA
ncbi:MAG TPA: ABC transporter ATP-binding protein [Sandaracinaceae bacterium LLY-WYZ-13_1]|nr:ABC transporter ATP-binding protein [Sandaracinaceae bacterium LLY-WYZ-13_1]